MDRADLSDMITLCANRRYGGIWFLNFLGIGYKRFGQVLTKH